MKIFNKIALAIVATLLSVSCGITGTVDISSLPSAKELRRDIRTDVAIADRKLIPMIREVRGPYVDLTPAVFSKGEEVLTGSVSFVARGVSFSEVAEGLARKNKIINSIAPDVLSKTLITPIDFEYTGELKGALDLLSKVADLSYRYSDGVVRWNQFETKSYVIAVPSGSIDWSMTSGGTSIGGISSGGGGEGGEGGGGGGSASLGDVGTVNVNSQLNLWEDIENSVKQIIDSAEQGASFTANPAVGTVTVTASTHDHEKIQAFVNQLNEELLVRVELELKILQVSLSDENSFGIDWSALQQTTEGLNASFGSGSPFTPTYNQISGSRTDVDNDVATVSDVSVLIEALSTQGEVLISDAPRAVTLNNNPVIISDIRSDAYVARTVAGISTGSGDSGVGLEPGYVATGVQFLVVPKVIGQDIVLQVQTTISTRGEFRTFTSDSGTIEAPEVSVSSNNLRVKVKNGQAVIIGGLKRTSHDGKDIQPLYVQALGSTSRNVSRVETILVITAKTLEG